MTPLPGPTPEPKPGPPPLLQVGDLSVWYGKALALEKVSVTVGEGEVVAVLGPNGAGKSTLLKAISRMQPSQGTLAVRGESLQGLAAHQVVGKGICHCPEGRRLFASIDRARLDVRFEPALSDPPEAVVPNPADDRNP